MAPKFQKVLAGLNNNAPPPKNSSLSHYGRLSKQDVQDLAAALKSSSFAGRIHLKCGVHLDWSLSSVKSCSLLTNRHCVLRVLVGRLRCGADSGCTEREQNGSLPEAAGYGLYWPVSTPSLASACFWTEGKTLQHRHSCWCHAGNSIDRLGAEAFASVLETSNFTVTTLDLSGMGSILTALPACNLVQYKHSR